MVGLVSLNPLGYGDLSFGHLVVDISVVVGFLNLELGSQVGFPKTPATHLWVGSLA